MAARVWAGRGGRDDFHQATPFRRYHYGIRRRTRGPAASSLRPRRECVPTALRIEDKDSRLTAYCGALSSHTRFSAPADTSAPDKTDHERQPTTPSPASLPSCPPPTHTTRRRGLLVRGQALYIPCIRHAAYAIATLDKGYPPLVGIVWCVQNAKLDCWRQEVFGGVTRNGFRFSMLK